MEVMDNWEYIELSDQEAEAVSGGLNSAGRCELCYYIAIATRAPSPIAPGPDDLGLVESIRSDISNNGQNIATASLTQVAGYQV